MYADHSRGSFGDGSAQDQRAKRLISVLDIVRQREALAYTFHEIRICKVWTLGRTPSFGLAPPPHNLIGALNHRRDEEDGEVVRSLSVATQRKGAGSAQKAEESQQTPRERQIESGKQVKVSTDGPK